MNRSIARCKIVSLSVSGLIVLATLCGCQDDAMKADSKSEKLSADVNAIATRSGGNWEKLKPEEKKTMLEVEHGNETAAKSLLHALSGQNYQGKWGKPGDVKAGKPAGMGAPGVPPTAPPASGKPAPEK